MVAKPTQPRVSKPEAENLEMAESADIARTDASGHTIQKKDFHQHYSRDDLQTDGTQPKNDPTRFLFLTLQLPKKAELHFHFLFLFKI